MNAVGGGGNIPVVDQHPATLVRADPNMDLKQWYQQCMWMIYSRVVRASDCQYQSRNCPEPEFVNV